VTDFLKDYITFLHIPVVAQVMAVFVGACAGSFLNVCVHRWPKERSVMRPRSRCPQCGYQLRWYDNIPVVSWLALRGRCRCCDERISARYPIVEAVVAMGWLASVLAFGPTFTAIRVAVFGTILLGVALTDFQDYLIPDGFTLGGLVWALLTMAIAFWLRIRSGATPTSDESLFAGPYDALVGACAGAGLIAIVGWLGEIATGKEAMGLGDVTLMAFIGAELGPTKALITVFLGATLACVVYTTVVLPVAWMRRGRAREQTELALGGPGLSLPLVPFGVFLAPAAFISLVWGTPLIDWILQR
jgi:leader peptidase (prepilin peptidase)/N-methyltransferase